MKITELDLKNKHTVHADLSAAEATARTLRLGKVEYARETSEIRESGTLEHITEQDLPQDWKITKRGSVGGRGGTRKTYYFYKKLPQ